MHRVGLGLHTLGSSLESYGCWGVEAQGSIFRLAARLALQLQCSKSKAISNIYQRLNLTLVRCNARALLSRARFQHSVGEVVCVSAVMPRPAFDNPVTFTAGRLDIDGHVHGQRWTV